MRLIAAKPATSDLGHYSPGDHDIRSVNMSKKRPERLSPGLDQQSAAN
jgi:hypothetical protein